MTAVFRNPAVLAAKATPTGAGDLRLNREVFDFANPNHRPAAIASTNRIQIGVIPAGCKFVPHLSALRLPAIDSNGTPTGQASIGTTANPAVLRAAASVGTAVVHTGEDFTNAANGDIGAKDVDVPLFATFTANVATVASTGRIAFDVVVRPYESGVDTDVL